MKKIDDFFKYRQERYKDIKLFYENKETENKNIEQFGVSVLLNTLSDMRESSNGMLEFNILETENHIDITILKYDLTLFEENRRNGKSYNLDFIVNNDGRGNNMKIEIYKADDLYEEQEKFSQKGLDYNILLNDKIESIITELLIDIREYELQSENPGLPNN